MRTTFAARLNPFVVVVLLSCGGASLRAGGARSGGAGGAGGAGGTESTTAPGGAGGLGGFGGSGGVHRLGGAGGTALGGTGGAGGVGGAGGTSGCICRPSPPCPAGWWEYTGSACDHGGSCWSYGDRLCYQSCSTDADCTDPGFPKCLSIIQKYEEDLYYYTNACASVPTVPACPNPGGYGGASAAGCVGGTGGNGPDAGPPCVPQSPGGIWATWKMPNPATTGLPNPASYTDHGNGTVLDTVTGLVWQRDVPPSKYTWYEANDYCESLALAGGSWRLPTRLELVSLVDYTRAYPGPVIDTNAFPNTPGEDFWSSSPRTSPYSCSQVWKVTFADGDVDFEPTTTALRVRCVQPPVATTSSHYQIAAGEVLDTGTGLIWQQVSGSSEMPWSDAQASCASSSLNGHTWRAPSIKELLTLVDESEPEELIDPTAFADVPASAGQFFWSSSPLAGGSSMAWYIYFAGGYTSVYDFSMGYRVRCVR